MIVFMPGPRKEKMRSEGQKRRAKGSIDRETVLFVFWVCMRRGRCIFEVQIEWFSCATSLADFKRDSSDRWLCQLFESFGEPHAFRCSNTTLYLSEWRRKYLSQIAQWLMSWNTKPQTNKSRPLKFKLMLTPLFSNQLHFGISQLQQIKGESQYYFIDLFTLLRSSPAAPAYPLNSP